jgi:hypothetical protein
MEFKQRLRRAGSVLKTGIKTEYFAVMICASFDERSGNEEL